MTLGKPMAQAKRKIPELEDLGMRDRLFNEFQLVTFEGLAEFLNLDKRTLQNRKPADLPPYTKVGGKRLFFKQDILAWMQKRKNRR